MSEGTTESSVNRIRRWTLFNSCDFPAMESYYSDMAAKGWFVAKQESSFTYFRKATPEKVQYRIIPKGFGNLSEEDMKRIKAQGWKHVRSVKGVYLFYSLERDAKFMEPNELKKSEALLFRNSSSCSYCYCNGYHVCAY